VATTRVSKSTKDEDDRLRKELANADIDKFKKIIKRAFGSKRSPKKTSGHRSAL